MGRIISFSHVHCLRRVLVKYTEHDPIPRMVIVKQVDPPSRRVLGWRLDRIGCPAYVSPAVVGVGRVTY